METSIASESKSQDKEEGKAKSASKNRRTKQQAQRQKAYALHQVPQVVHKGHNVPFAHRLRRKSPRSCGRTSQEWLTKWKNKYYNMKGLSQKAGNYLQQGPDLERLRAIVWCEIWGQFDMDSFKVIQNMHTPMGFHKMMSAPLWASGNVSANGRTTLLRN